MSCERYDLAAERAQERAEVERVFEQALGYAWDPSRLRRSDVATRLEKGGA
jgi:hypothetical protein